MKQQSYKLTIDNPCKQGWASMTEGETGKFCSHCSKTVVDLTNFSDNELIKLIEQTPGSLCGRLTKQQLNRQLLQVKQQSTNSHFYKILAGLLFLGTAKNTFANDRHTRIEFQATMENNHSPAQKTNRNEIETSVTDSVKNVVQGKISDAETKEPLPGVSIIIKDTKARVTTDVEGNFKLIIPDNLLTEKTVLTITYIGYEQMEIVINKNDLPLTKELSLLLVIEEDFLLGDVSIEPKKKGWRFWK